MANGQRGQPPKATGRLQVTISRTLHEELIESATKVGANLARFIEDVLRDTVKSKGLVRAYHDQQGIEPKENDG